MVTNTKEYMKKYYEDHKAHIKEIMSQKEHCPACNKEIIISHRNRHQRTQKHILKAQLLAVNRNAN